MTLNVTGFNIPVNQSEADEIVISYIMENYPYLSPFVYDDYIKRGDFEVTVTSPMSTTSKLLFDRPFDIINTEGYYKWPFLSVLNWGENPRGNWTIRVLWTNSNGGSGIVSDVSAVLYGVSQVPQSVADIPDRCSSSCARPKGCSGPDPDDCDACNSDLLRNATSLECIQKNKCVPPYEIASGYCYIPSSASVLAASIMLLFGCFITIFTIFY